MVTSVFRQIFFIFVFAASAFATPIVSVDTTSSVRLHHIFSDYSEFVSDNDPFVAASRGDRTANGRLPDASTTFLSYRRDFMAKLLQRIDAIDPAALETQDQISRRLFRRQLHESIEEFDLEGHRLPLNGWWDYHATFAEQPVRLPFNDLTDFENYLSRMQDFPRWNQQYLHRLQQAVTQGWVRPRVVLDNYIPTVEALVTPLPESRFMQPFYTLMEQERLGSAEEREAIFRRGQAVVQESVLAEYEKLARFLRETYYLAASETIGISALPGGGAYYEHLVRHYTTLDITAAEIHQTGLAEVARIRAEMEVVIAQTGWEGSFSEFVHFLRTDPQFYATSAEELLQITALALKRMDGELPRYFGRLPRTPYGIREVPLYMAPRMTTAYYSRAPQDGSAGGFYYVNTWNLPARPIYEIEALSFHEAVPGHHLQIALQQELTDLPAFRQSGGFTVFVEGWALYSEYLALEMGFYRDPYSNFGRLSYEMWRALRLVVDTGIHAQGWTRDQAIEFMAENSALTLVNIRNEVDRYIFWPGQALAYKTGEIKIRALRRLAEAELGTNFDIRQFHDVVLANGAVTLEVLDEIVSAWIQIQKQLKVSP